MIGPTVGEMLLEGQETFLIPAENMVNVVYRHPSSCDLLMSLKVGYSEIPVSGKDDHFVGLVSLSDVVSKMIDLQTIGMDLLERLTVADVTETDVPIADENWELEEIPHLLVDSLFLPAVTEDRIFEGVITRKELFKAVNFMVYELEHRSILSPKIEELRE